MEGGFNGRTNKLVDGCYSFWQGGIFQVLQKLNQHQLLSTTASGPSTFGGGAHPQGKVRDTSCTQHSQLETWHSNAPDRFLDFN